MDKVTTNTGSNSNTSEPHYLKTEFYIGLGLAISSSFFIGSSFIIKKVSLLRLNRGGSLRAGSGGFGYLRDWMWWLGFLTMGLGELLNFTAYGFAPASLVTPLGALSVLVSAVLASKCLNESLNVYGKLGCVLCILGSVIIIIHAPKEEQLASLDELIIKLQDQAFINYLLFVLVLVVAIIVYFGPRYGTKYASVYIILCSAVGSLTVMACKGLGLAIKDALSASEPLHSRNTWVGLALFTSIVICICIQMNYLNKALDLFSTSVVTPIYYVMFTTLVIVVSTILFKEWNKMAEQNVIGGLCGFFVTVVAIFLLSGYKDGVQNSQALLRSTTFGSKEYGSGMYYARNV